MTRRTGDRPHKKLYDGTGIVFVSNHALAVARFYDESNV